MRSEHTESEVQAVVLLVGVEAPVESSPPMICVPDGAVAPEPTATHRALSVADSVAAMVEVVPCTFVVAGWTVYPDVAKSSLVASWLAPVAQYASNCTAVASEPIVTVKDV